ncbi:Sec-independent protein translocase protein TatB [Devosia sp. YIM 151766]|uniref:Sec-independent protein translocase protein TatB n=1 Tax=Devosia sp. YIM 151766 TaxID=3017325 RepID=UPI00255CCD53|nr:Sec-independent protein translocase protein TatB [Devosia sp. YIM 151766]WIY54191.1 Sec-independent protein translocase protein TatB [Devosia sp. YIM 151766]
MIGLGWTEMLVIGVVALIVIGPKDLPVVMGRVGKVIGQIQRMGREFQREINKSTGLDEVRNLRSTITDPLKKTADEIRKEFNAIGKDGQQSPTGALKPTDPKVESVADAIKQQAGMTPAKSASGTGAKPGPATTVAAAPAKAAPAKKPAKPKAAAAAKPAKTAAKPAASKAEAAAAKPARKPRSKPAAAATPAAAVKKPRALRPKPAETAEKS